MPDSSKADIPEANGDSKGIRMDALRQVLKQEDSVLFVGSGISQWSGLPSWNSMIEELARFVESSGASADLVRSEARRGDLLQAASYGFHKLTKQQVGNFIRAACRYGVARPSSIHRKIVSLGPRCFVTTNYDDLIEQSVRTWQPNRFLPPPITNRHLTETARIVHARALDFIFKPHGDAGDVESVILTREQYRVLLPQGERHAALDALKVLLASRPVVYFGFGLRDPDFMYLRDILANTYLGGIRDHYAIMADVQDDEIDYWRRNYGIHLIRYETAEKADSSRDHSELLNLLDSLLEAPRESITPPSFDPNAPTTLLALARYASALTTTARVTPELEIRVHTQERAQGRRTLSWTRDTYEHAPVERFLSTGPSRALLIGLPGSGKSYGIRRAVAHVAQLFHDACLSESTANQPAILPVLVDLKLYRGDLFDLASCTLPKSLPLEEILKHFRVKFFVDSFNEMPREYLESSSHESDFTAFVQRVGTADLVIGSRTDDGLKHLGLPTYVLDEISEGPLTAELERRGIRIEGRFSREVSDLLRRPFFFQYVANGTVTVPREDHPRAIYQSIFEGLRSGFELRFKRQFNIEDALSKAAYQALNQGEEAFPLSVLLSALRTSLDASALPMVNEGDIANWLVSASILTPYTSGRVGFIHQSITEYLASMELARLYQADRDLLKEKLRFTRWDQALFLTLSILPESTAAQFLKDVMDADFQLALRASKYLEQDRDRVVASLISECPRRAHSYEDSHSIAWALQNDVPVSDRHEDLLWDILRKGDMLGGAAAARLVELKGPKIKGQLIELLVEYRSDYNFCANGIGPALSHLATEEDARVISAHAASLEPLAEADDEKETTGFTSGSAALLADLDIEISKRVLLPQERSVPVPMLSGRILCEILVDFRERRSSTARLELAADLLLRDVPGAPFAVYMVGDEDDADKSMSWAHFTEAHVNRLIARLSDEESWSLLALRNLCAKREDLARTVLHAARNSTGLWRACLMYCVSAKDVEPVFQSLKDLATLDAASRPKEPLHFLEFVELDWSGRGALLLQLLTLRDKAVAQALFGGSSHPQFQNLGPIRITPIEWWLDWIAELLREDTQDNENHWLVHQLGNFIVQYASREDQEQLLTEFNRSGSERRSVLAATVLPGFVHITTDEFTEDAISFALAELGRSGTKSLWSKTLLGRAASEKFVIDRLLPLLPTATGRFLTNLRTALGEAGLRHGRRYVFDDKDPA